MDFIRAAIKTCFYDYPLVSASNLIKEGRYDDFCSKIVDIVKWTEPSFTLTELTSLRYIIEDKWIKTDLRGNEVKGSEMSRLFLMLNHFNKDVLNETDDPTVKFDDLLRWHEISKFIGENVLTTPYFAEKDLINKLDRKNFTWPDIIRHNNPDLNRLLDEGLSDVHAHLYASTDIFAENWISLMNHVAFAKIQSKKNVLVGFNRPYQDADINVWDELETLTLHQWGLVAAAIRVQLCKYLYQNVSFDQNQIIDMMNSPSLCMGKVSEILGDIGFMSMYSMRLSNDKVLDYALNKSDVKFLNGDCIKSPYMLHVGERRMLYNYFTRYFSSDKKAICIAPMVYLYLLIKSKYRREFVQTNPFLGFENFKRYQDQKKLFSEYHNSSIAYKYAVQTAIGSEGKNFLEARVSSRSVDHIRHSDYNKTIFGEADFFKKDVSDNLTLVVHFLKSNDFRGTTSCRHSKLRNDLFLQMGEVLKNTKNNRYASCNKKPLLVGIDAAGAELNCRPEVFAPFFRWAKNEGLANITYHAGEDFYDLIDGLRTIDETILFMEYQCGWRIGHGLALGVDAKKYYTNRHFHAIMPKQYMLDDCVWLKYKSLQYDIALNSLTASFLDEKIHELLVDIGYGEQLDIYYYWQSMLLRGDRIKNSKSVSISSYEMAAECNDKLCVLARKSPKAVELHELYETNLSVRNNGNKPDDYKLPHSICDDVTAIQEAMMKEIEDKGIYIECNPSSNIKIGPFEKYEDLPVTRFSQVRERKTHRINISINTDDRGVFSTSLYNEYSLMAIALMKMLDDNDKRLYSNEEILDYLKRIIQNGINQRFKDPKVIS